MSTPMRQLGRDGPLVTAVGLGLMSIGGAYGQKDTEAEKLAVLDRAHAIGECFWDTADVYVSCPLPQTWILQPKIRAIEVPFRSASP